MQYRPQGMEGEMAAKATTKNATNHDETVKAVKAIRKELADFQAALDRLNDYVQNGPQA